MLLKSCIFSCPWRISIFFQWVGLQFVSSSPNKFVTQGEETVRLNQPYPRLPLFSDARMPSRFGQFGLFAALWTLAHQAPLFVGFSRQEHCSGVPSPPPDLPDPGIKPRSLASPALASEFFTSVPPGKSSNEEQCYLNEKVWEDNIFI